MEFKVLKTICTGLETILPGGEITLENQADIDWLILNNAISGVNVAKPTIGPVQAAALAASVAEIAGNSGSAKETDTDESGNTDSEDDQDTDEPGRTDETDLTDEGAESRINTEPLMTEVTEVIPGTLGIACVNADIEKVLFDAGFNSIAKIKSASIEQLVALPKIGYAIGRKIMAEVNKA